MPEPMSTETLNERAPARPDETEARYSRWLGHPLAFLLTAAILLALFGSTFILNGDRVAPTKDPAYYTWRTETLISDEPATLLEVEGAYEMFSGGYRIAASVIGGFLRHIPGISSLNMTIFLMVLVPVLTALLLGGYAYRQRRDPLIFHCVALGVGSLYLTPPFVGYLDNILCLMFLAAAIWFIEPARRAWPGRIMFFIFLLLAGFTHPTSLVIFCLTLGLMSAARLVFRKFDLRSVIRDDLAMLLTAFASAVATFLVWQVGIWGKSAKLTEAALPPPYDSDFFVDRLVSWVANPAEGGFFLLRGPMTPLLNGALLIIGVVGLFALGRKWVEDDLATVSIAWLAPLAGLFGFLLGKAYTYYRFFNATLAWVLLVGLGAYFLIRWGAKRSAALGALAAIVVLFVFGLNFMRGFDSSHWNEPDKGWLSATERADLDALRGSLTGDDTPVVFVIDSETPGFQVWGETKLAGNTSRYGLPQGQVDQGYLYLGSLENFLNGEPTFKEGDQPTEECEAEALGTNTYNCVSFGLHEDAQAGIERAGKDPIVVVASIFNATGANADLPDTGLTTTTLSDTRVWALGDGEITSIAGEAPPSGDANEEDSAGILHLLRVLVCFGLLLIPGLLLLRYAFPDTTFAEGVAMVPALAIGLLTIVGIAVLAITRSEFSALLAWVSLAVSVGLAAFAAVRSGGELPPARLRSRAAE
jgi:hypothetical protein